MPQQEFINVDCYDEILEIFSSFQAKNIFLVTGKLSYNLSGAKEIINKLSSSISFTRFSDFHNNPQLTDVEKGITLFNKGQFDATLAIGGGSVIDMAKLITSLASQPNTPLSFILQSVPLQKKPIPLIAIPTTAGSGSEATHFAVIYINKKKYSLAHQWILPSYTILDPNLSMNLPPSITASSGMDALCQAIESYWSINSTDRSKEFATKAMQLVLQHLPSTYESPTIEGRLALLKAAHLAGQAINITKTTAAHAFSYPFTTHFGIPHGHAVSLTIGDLIVFNSQVSSEDVSDSRGVNYVQQSLTKLYSLLGTEDAQSARKIVQELMIDIGLATTFQDLKIDMKKNWDLINRSFNLDRLRNNPRLFTPVTLKSFFFDLK